MSISSRQSRAAKLEAAVQPPLDPAGFSGDASKEAVRLTAKAIEMAKQALVRRGTPDGSLRLGVRGGGCSGVSYAIEFSDKLRPRDHLFDFDGLRVVVDPKSLVYLRGSVLDYEVQLMQHGFKFRNPNEKSNCGCGESFSV
jgi:iron-sulfur cluster assembly protein